MMKCWMLSPEDRPTFKELTSYLELNMVLLLPANDDSAEESDSD